MDFKLASDFQPAGSQPEAIKGLVKGINDDLKYQTLLGVTGSGKTFTMAKIIESVQKPTLIMSPNKTLAAQLYSEFKDFFPENAVEYFVSYYDYYQPEAYLPASDTYIDKDADINSEIEKLRHRATASLLDRDDVIVVATVSAIYGLGSPEEYEHGAIVLKINEKVKRDDLIRRLVDMHYERNQLNITEGMFRVRGAQLDIFPPYSETIFRIDADEKVTSIKEIDPVSNKTIHEHDTVHIFPAVHYMLDEGKKMDAITSIRQELNNQLKKLESNNNLLEANRLKQRTNYDLELISELGYCKGIENYSRHLEGRTEGQPPYTLIDFFPKDWLCFIDESHIAIPQIGGMFKGDRSRKETLIQYGFRLPSALDNRPFNFEEFDNHLNQVVYVSATPRDYEREVSQNIMEQIIRPTGLIDPDVDIRPASNQVEDFEKELKKRIQKNQRVLVTTLTKRMSEDLAQYLEKKGHKVKYLHSEIDTLERIDILADLRRGEIDVVVGVNLLREGLDLPEVSLVAIMDADQEGFLRNETSLVQTIGRCSRNIDGKVILYADKKTKSITNAIVETDRRRNIQIQYNKKHNITPQSIQKGIKDRIVEKQEKIEKEHYIEMPTGELNRLMREAAERMDFEQAIILRDILEDRKDGGK